MVERVDQRHEHVRQLRTAFLARLRLLVEHHQREHGEHREPASLGGLRGEEGGEGGAGGQSLREQVLLRPRVVGEAAGEHARAHHVERPHQAFLRDLVQVAGECFPHQLERGVVLLPLALSGARRRGVLQQAQLVVAPLAQKVELFRELVDVHAERRRLAQAPLVQQVEGHLHGPLVLFRELRPQLVRAEVGERELGVVHEHQARLARQLHEHVAGVDGRGRLDASVPHHLVVHVPEVRHLHVRGLDALRLAPSRTQPAARPRRRRTPTSARLASPPRAAVRRVDRVLVVPSGRAGRGAIAKPRPRAGDRRAGHQRRRHHVRGESAARESRGARRSPSKDAAGKPARVMPIGSFGTPSRCAGKSL